jgi:uncharacterized membrane protein
MASSASPKPETTAVSTAPGAGAWVVLLAVAPALLLLALAAPWPWLPIWLGRFHRVVLHFPIALLLLAGLLEMLHVLRPSRFPPASRLLLFLAAAGAALAAACGFLLLRTEGIEGALADRHLRTGAAVAGLSVVVLALRLGPGFAERRGRRLAFRTSLAAGCGLVVVAGHDGASLTHGKDYLTESLPWRDKGAPAVARAVSFPRDRPPAEWQAWTEVVQPILISRCADCHAAGNVKGKLVLDTWEGLARGGAAGPLFVAGRPQDSLLMTRLELPLSHKEHMPPRRKPQPGEGELELLRAWIAAGAPQAGTLADLKAGPALVSHAAALPTALVSAAAAEEAEAAERTAREAARAAIAGAVADLQRRYPGAIDWESRSSADLVVNAALLGAAFGDADLAALAPVAERIVWLDLSGTAVTDAAAAALAGFRRLRLLRLNETRVGDATVAALAGHPALETLSLFRTAITPASRSALERFPRLRTLSVAETAAARPPV